MQYPFSHILLTKNPIEEANIYYENNNPQFFRLFCAEDLNIEIARAIIDESYIASNGIKTLLFAANSFNIPAQNALLKVLEEPPSQIIFILFTKMKSLLLPTIRSRIPIMNKIQKTPLPPFPLEIQTLNLQKVYDFLKERQKEFGSSERKSEIEALYMDCIKSGLFFNEQEHRVFEEALVWDSQKEKHHNILLVLLLMVLKVKQRNFRL